MSGGGIWLIICRLFLPTPPPPRVLLPHPYKIWKYIFIFLVPTPYSGLHNSEVNIGFENSLQIM